MKSMEWLRRSPLNCLFLFVLIAAALGSISGSCPNNCNRQGTCDKYSRCHCATGFQGGDCSERICPFGKAWSDEAFQTDMAHAESECSNRGICDRITGRCDCMVGFTGSACERLTCESDCNDAGVCISMHDFANRYRNEDSKKSLTILFRIQILLGMRKRSMAVNVMKVCLVMTVQRRVAPQGMIPSL